MSLPPCLKSLKHRSALLFVALAHGHLPPLSRLSSSEDPFRAWRVYSSTHSTMPRGQAKRSSAIRPSDWEPHRQEICELYATRPLEKVQAIVQRRHGFHPTLSQYKRRLGIWGVVKNQRPPMVDNERVLPGPDDLDSTWVRLVLLVAVCPPLPVAKTGV